MAALLMCGAPFLSRRAADSIAIATAAASTACAAWLLSGFEGSPVPYWFGGWEPEGGVALGIAFVLDPFSLALAILAGALGTASFLFSWHYFDSVGTLFHTLMLVFIGGMIGFCLSGDLFTLFVFFELMGVAAYALTGFKIEESSLSGSVNFAVTNSIAAFMILMGIGLVYGRTGALNLAQIGRTLALGPADGLVVAALVLVICGLLVKGAIVPFHFWLADAHAVAPSPVCVLFSGIMVELGLYGAARVYWTVFSGVFPNPQAAVDIFFWGGIVTAVFGGLLCYIQRHLKRLLAFSTISHMGIMLAGISLLDPVGLAGAAIYLVVHGLVKGSLFLGAGIVLHDLSGVDEFELRGRGKHMTFVAGIFVVGGLMLAALPVLGMSTGKSLIEKAAETQGHHWIRVLLFFPSALTGGAVLRAAGRIFAGWGKVKGEEKTGATESETPETHGPHERTPGVMAIPAATLMGGAILLGLLPGIAERSETEARLFQDWACYGAAVLESPRACSPPAVNPAVKADPSSGLYSTLGAIFFAFFALSLHRIPRGPRALMNGIADPLSKGLQRLHSGHVGDYAAWLTLGVTVYGYFLILLKR